MLNQFALNINLELKQRKSFSFNYAKIKGKPNPANKTNYRVSHFKNILFFLILFLVSTPYVETLRILRMLKFLGMRYIKCVRERNIIFDFLAL